MLQDRRNYSARSTDRQRNPSPSAVAPALLGTGVLGMLEYPIVAVGRCTGSNVIAVGYARSPRFQFFLAVFQGNLSIRHH